MIVRLWKVGINQGKRKALEEFANTISLPMFRQQEGCLGVFFTYTEKICTVITLWKEESSLEKLDNSKSYQEVVNKIESSKILKGDSKIEIFQSFGGFLNEDIKLNL